MAITNKKYWAKRANQRLVNTEQIGLFAYQKTLKIYEQAFRNIDRDIKAIYANYEKKGILDVSELEKAIQTGGKNEFLKAVKKKAKILGLDPKKIYDDRFLTRISRLDALLEKTRLEIMSIAPREDAITGKGYERIIKTNYAQSQKDFKDAGFKISSSFTTLDQPVVDAILSSEWEGRNYSDSVWSNVEKLALELPTIMGSSLLAGQSYQKTSRLIRDRFGVSTYEAQRLVRTETNYFQGQSEVQSYIDDGIERYEYHAHLDGRTSQICTDLNGRIFFTKDAKVGVNYNPMHPNCILGGQSAVAFDVSAKFISRYNGLVFRITTTKGACLSITPNHQVLTGRGWVRASELNHGDYLLNAQVNVKEVTNIKPNIQTSKARIENIIVPDAVFFGSMPSSPVDFHGDGISNQKVDIILSERGLRDNFNGQFPQGFKEFSFIGRLITKFSAHANRTFNQAVKRLLGATYSVMSIFGIYSIFFRRSSGHHQPVSFSLVAKLNKILSQYSLNRGHRDFASFSKFFEAGAMKVTRDYIISIKSSNFSGHVYDLTTGYGWYICNNIIISNCRSTTVPVFPGEIEDRVRLEHPTKDWKTSRRRLRRLTQPSKEPTLEEKYKKAMQKQMNPNKAVHDYNADMNKLTQALKGKELSKAINELMGRIPKNHPLRPALERVAGLQGWKG